MMEIELMVPSGGRIRCRIPQTRWQRTRGLLGLSGLEPDRAMFIPNASSVHTFGMRFPVLVARLDAELRVVEIRRLGPRRLLLPRRAVRHVLEGSTELDLRVGDVLCSDQAGQPPSPAAPVTTHDPA
jgi:hypothetical protein